MFTSLDNMGKVSLMMDLITQRQRALGSNLANMDTPGYVRRDVNFSDYLGSMNSPLETKLSEKLGYKFYDEELVENIMIEDYISVITLTDKEEVGILFSKYDLLNIPVTDNENRLVGVVSIDDAVDVITEEATEDFELMAAMSPSEKPYMQTGVFTLAKNRIVWLLLLMISATVSGAILTNYEDAFSAYPLLVTFITMLTGTGGNAGSQTATLVIRGMALNEIEPSDIFKVLWKEFRVSLLVGVCLALVNFARIMIFNPGNTIIAAIVSVSLIFTIMLSKIIAAVLPMLVKKLGADPALMASPLITTIVDALSLMVYFSIAQSVLGIS